MLAAVAFCSSGSAKKHDGEPNVPPQPAQRIALESLGLHGAPTHTLLRSQAEIATLDFLDDTHVLLTFVERPLMRRDDVHADEISVPVSASHPRDDRMVHAEVVDLASGTIGQQCDWRVYDKDPYLMALGGGKFLLRQGGRLSLVDAALQPQKLAESHLPIVYAQADAGSGLMLVETEHEIHTPEQHVKMAHDALLFNAPPPVEEADVVGWKLPLEGPPSAVLFRAHLPQRGVLTGSSQGIIQFSGAVSGKFELFFVPFDAQQPKRFLLKLKSECRPATNMLRQDVLLVTACQGNGDEFYAVNTAGALLWKEQTETGSLPDYVVSGDGKRFAVQSVGSGPVPLSINPGEDDFARGLVQVFDVDTGIRVFVTVLEPLYGAYRTVALSSDGRKLAVLRKGALEVFLLPPLAETPVRKK